MDRKVPYNNSQDKYNVHFFIFSLLSLLHRGTCMCQRMGRPRHSLKEPGVKEKDIYALVFKNWKYISGCEKMQHGQFNKIHSTVSSLYELVRTKHRSWVVSTLTLHSANPKFRCLSGDCPTQMTLLYISSEYQIRVRPSFSTSFTIHYSLITLPINKCIEDLPFSGIWHTVIVECMVLCPSDSHLMVTAARTSNFTLVIQYEEQTRLLNKWVSK